jgi:hypothetical protein
VGLENSQSLHHFLTASPWQVEEVREQRLQILVNKLGIGCVGLSGKTLFTSGFWGACRPLNNLSLQHFYAVAILLA